MELTQSVGHNVIHLIYPLRSRRKEIDEIFNERQEWERIYRSGEEGSSNLDHLFPDEYFFPDEKYRKWIPDDDLFSYFHPSVQSVLFPDDSMDRMQNKNHLKVFRLHKSSKHLRKYAGQISDDNCILFEWISAEIFIFSKHSAFLVARVCMLENYVYDNWMSEKVHFTRNHRSSLENNQKLNVWISFANRIRQNYRKHHAQPSMSLYEVQGIVEEKMENTVKVMVLKSDHSFFYDYVQDLLTPLKLLVSNKYLDAAEFDYYWNDVKQGKGRTKRLMEPNAFIHGFVQCDLQKQPLKENEMFALLSIDDMEKSASDDVFIREFLNSRIYTRWAPNSVYTGIDYGLMTVVKTSKVYYRNAEDTDSEFADLLYQHHCRHYLVLILLQLYYRDELQELIGRYARLKKITSLQGKHVADDLLTTYYHLNQHFFFDRITNEVQGTELWSFYQRVLGIKELYAAVQRDMQELNQRLIQAANEEQTKKINRLTLVAGFAGILGMNLLVEKPTDQILRRLPDWIYSLAYLKGMIHFILESMHVVFNVAAVGVTFFMVWFFMKTIWDTIKRK